MVFNCLNRLPYHFHASANVGIIIRHYKSKSNILITRTIRVFSIEEYCTVRNERLNFSY